MVYGSGGISYTELKAMDFAEYAEARQAWLILLEEAREARQRGAAGNGRH
jgi:hypothetical protein